MPNAAMRINAAIFAQRQPLTGRVCGVGIGAGSDGSTSGDQGGTPRFVSANGDDACLEACSEIDVANP